ncbi:hypothetical protein GUITHDRAFT_141008 [Guillardia theta CCMP2712]|uniref:Rhodanese domain-containing protein n=1 Tax=Guillardia theta (strain CCMP2712) TaxID=905079 RepID=L1J306_GUITC|nr:hypothetical protein GUITHDRAFT_141008 [Guillardia theta CCMP2712]EKX42886.1 hypothetical protein GUITHDRAFT_141008 [Guillardia theta CCMP2712]|eukprot:XP_005829866.1 hypothetical protein GUITHDRAFT_141008 [Guillardia theta CCMP2712]
MQTVIDVRCQSCDFFCKAAGGTCVNFRSCPLRNREKESLETASLTDIIFLLYYSYVDISDVGRRSDGTRIFASVAIRHLNLRGRVRISHEGVNVVLEGLRGDIDSYIAVIRGDGRWGTNVDFKLSGLNGDRGVEEQRFKSLSVKETSEVVSIGLRQDLYPHFLGATHLTPQEWHEKLQKSREQGQDVVLLDTRNVYESRIGKFECEGVETIVPNIRQFTDFPKFVDDNIDLLRGKTVMMYCTGGVRCERASAYVKEKLQTEEGEGEKEQGQGKNFVFDPRRYEPMHDGNVLGRCHVCGSPHDAYDNGPECRCKTCRLLLLVCDECRGKET